MFWGPSPQGKNAMPMSQITKDEENLFTCMELAQAEYADN